MKRLIMLLLVANSAYAADIYGAYVEVEAGSSSSSAFNYGLGNSTAMRVDGGVKISPYVAVEAGFSGLTNPNINAKASSLEFYDASLKGSILLGKTLELHPQLGMAYGISSGGTNGYNPDTTLKILAGIGLDVNLSKNFAIVVNDYAYLSPNLDSNSGVGGNTNVVMGGIKYNF